MTSTLSVFFGFFKINPYRKFTDALLNYPFIAGGGG